MNEVELISRFNAKPFNGLSPDDLHSVISAIGSSKDVDDNRILSILGRDSGIAYVKTGAMHVGLDGRGQLVVLSRKSNGAWQIDQVESWAS